MSQNSPRKVNDVYNQILPLIPEDKITLRNELTEYVDSLWNIAPEELKTGYCWNPFLNILNSNIKEISEPWEIQIQSIIANK